MENKGIKIAMSGCLMVTKTEILTFTGKTRIKAIKEVNIHNCLIVDLDLVTPEEIKLFENRLNANKER